MQFIDKHLNILFTALFFLSAPFFAMAQPAPAPAQSEPILILGAKAHLGNGQVIENSAIGFEDGKLVLVADATVIRLDRSKYKKVIDASGKQVFPGFIATNTPLGLIEIDAVRATRDNGETGEMNPNVRSLIAYSTDSRVTPVVRSNGVLLAQITPQGGRISGQSSVVELDAWNWEDAAYRSDDGIHLNWPFTGSGNARRRNEDYPGQVQALRDFFNEASAYARKATVETKNTRFDAMRGLFDSSKTLYIHASDPKAITESIQFAEGYNIHPVLVGGEDSWMVADVLKEKSISVILAPSQRLPRREDDDIDQPFKTAGQLQQAGVLFCFSQGGTWQQQNLCFQAGQAVGYGLSYEGAISALTLNSARILGIDKTVGSLETGKDATLFICEGDPLDMRGNQVIRAFIHGRDIDLDNKQKELYRKYKAKYK